MFPVHDEHIPKHLLDKLDTSCEKENLPAIEHGRLLDVRKSILKDGKNRKKHYKLAEYQCETGYQFKHSAKMFCSKGQWIGKKPKCEKSRKFHTVFGTISFLCSFKYIYALIQLLEI